MNFLFVGCSITWGDELKDRLNTRYSKLVCDALGANEHNIAECGQCNDWIARRTVEETRKRRYDRIYVQLTIPSRLEYFTEKDQYRTHKFRTQMMGRKEERFYHEGRWYYKMVYNRQLGIENMYKNKFLIENAVDYRTPLIFLSADCCGENKKRRWWRHEQSYWYQLCRMKHHWIWDEMLGHAYREGPLGEDETHPLEPSHQKIANYLLNHGK